MAKSTRLMIYVFAIAGTAQKTTSVSADNLAVGVAILLSAEKHPFASEFFIPFSPFRNIG